MTITQPSLPVRSSDWHSFALLLGGFLGLYWALSPATIQGDGIGYLKQIQDSSLSPGHLAYLPLLRILAQLYPHTTLLELVPPLRLLSIIFAVGSLLLFWDCARSLFPAREALFSVALLGGSHAFWRSAAEVEVYATATFFATALLWTLIRFALAPSPRARVAWAVLAGTCYGMGVFFHLTLVFLGPSMVGLLMLWAPPGSRIRAGLLGGVTAALVVSVPLILILRAEGHSTPAAALVWLGSADHGLPYRLAWYTPAVVLYGLAKSMVFSPYPHQAPWLKVIWLTALGLAYWTVLVIIRSRRHPRWAGWPLVLGWCLPLVSFAIFFYPSDTERWIFILPALCLFLTPTAGSKAVLLIGLMVLTNLISFQLPRALDKTPAARAAAAEGILGPRDLVIFPGHGWDELIGLGQPQPPNRLPLIYFIGAEKNTRLALAYMRRQMRATWTAGGQVFVARLKDDQDPQGFKELAWFGLTPAAFEALFQKEAPQPTRVPGLWLLSNTLQSG